MSDYIVRAISTDGLVQDPETGATAISRADLDNLEQIGDELGVAFHHRTGPGGMDRIAESFASSYVESEEGGRPAQHDLTWLFGLVLLGLVLFELRAGWQAVWSSQHALEPASPPSGSGGAR